MIKCSNCGFKNSDDDIYCVRCAKKLSEGNDVNDKTAQLNELYYSFLLNEMKNKNNETKQAQHVHDEGKIQQDIPQPQQDITTETLDAMQQPQMDVITSTSDDLITADVASVDETIDENKKQENNQNIPTQTFIPTPTQTPIEKQPSPTSESTQETSTVKSIKDDTINKNLSNNQDNATYFSGNEVKKSKTYIGGVEQLTSKRQTIATILSMAFIGLGFIYLRNMQRFITYLVLQVVMLLTAYLMVSINISGTSGVFDLIFIINVIIYLYSIVDSYKKAGE